MSKLLLILFFCLLFGCDHPESQAHDQKQNESASILSRPNTGESDKPRGHKVVGIKDGDTFVLLIGGKEQTVRLAHIDCPEKNQPYGSKAKQFVSALCFGKYVTLIHDNKFDRNKRLIGEIVLDDHTNLNKALVENGLAWHFKKYSKDREYATLEMDAGADRIGLWSDKDPTPPWEWRNPAAAGHTNHKTVQTD